MEHKIKKVSQRGILILLTKTDIRYTFRKLPSLDRFGCQFGDLCLVVM